MSHLRIKIPSISDAYKWLYGEAVYWNSRVENNSLWEKLNSNLGIPSLVGSSRTSNTFQRDTEYSNVAFLRFSFEVGMG